MTLDIPQEIQGQMPAEIVRQLISSVGPRKNHEFVSEDGNWTVNVTRTFLALTTTDYMQWQHFREKLLLPLDALNALYSPPFFSRIGLRYVDVIKRSAYGLSEAPWDQLLKPYIAGFLGSPDVSEEIRSLENRVEIQLEDEESLVRVITRLAASADNEELNFVIDSDFFHTARTPISKAVNKLDFFNMHGSRLFRWSITDKLHQALVES